MKIKATRIVTFVYTVEKEFYPSEAKPKDILKIDEKVMHSDVDMFFNPLRPENLKDECKLEIIEYD